MNRGNASKKAPSRAGSTAQQPSKEPKQSLNSQDKFDNLTEEQQRARDAKRVEKETQEIMKDIVKQKSYLEQYGEEGLNKLMTNEMNYFAFETRIRTKLRNIIEPMVVRQIADREQMNEIQIIFNDIVKRLVFIEGVFEQGQGKNVVFDRIMETCNNAEIERLRFTAYVQGQIDQLN